MLEWREGISLGFAVAGTFFFFAGSVGLFRLPDVYSRLHALSKADNLGLGLIVIAAMVWAGDLFVIAKLAVVWVLILIASACLCFLIAGEALARGKPVADPGEDAS